MSDMARTGKHHTLLHRFIDEHARDIERLRTHVAAGERDAACTIAHNLKGIAGLLGDDRVVARAADLHTALRLGADADAIMQLVDACAAALEGFTAS